MDRAVGGQVAGVPGRFGGARAPAVRRRGPQGGAGRGGAVDAANQRRLEPGDSGVCEDDADAQKEDTYGARDVGAEGRQCTVTETTTTHLDTSSSSKLRNSVANDLCFN